MKHLETAQQKNALYLDTLLPLCAQYDGFVVDLWGVIHNGRELFPGVKDGLTYLHEQNKTVVFLTNSPRRSYNIVHLLDAMGVEKNLYKAIFSSGDLLHKDLLSSTEENLKNLQPRCLCIDELNDHTFFEGLNIELVESIHKADFLLITTISGPVTEAMHYQTMLKIAAKRELPLICANADKTVYVNGHEHVRPGLLAEWYQSYGGRAYVYGKPDKRMFMEALKYFPDMPASKILMVGDNFDTDIKGALNAGLDSAVVISEMTGSFYNSETHTLTLEKLAPLIKAHPDQSIYCVPGFAV
ncbi:MAG: TIGR01459 family HAD-type hydrolase [Alphaproteobacteria bacterium]|nr:TIGR01459 family HAD-type hydrolase [Alphaproteobacteria bacterium]